MHHGDGPRETEKPEDREAARIARPGSTTSEIAEAGAHTMRDGDPDRVLARCQDTDLAGQCRRGPIMTGVPREVGAPIGLRPPAFRLLSPAQARP
jgi:hypothetical protein